MPGILYVVATPIGNLEDLSARAARVLAEVDAIAAEDTRVTRKLLSHLGVHRPTLSLHAHSGPARVDEIVGRLLGGESIALVTDAGAPGVSDPGTELVATASDRGIRVVPIPGPSAVTTAVMAAGIAARGFRFIGFLGRSPGKRRRELAALAHEPCALVLFEAPDRVAGLLSLAVEVFGPDRPAAVCRELTKVHEEVLRGTLATLAGLSITTLGELTVVIGPAPEGHQEPPAGVTVDERVAELLALGKSVRDAADIASTELGIGRSVAYEAALRWKRDPSREPR